MPISIDEFESHEPGGGETNAELVVRFLLRNREQAYKAVEIAEATGVKENSIHPVLKRLESSGLIRHREPYWAIADPGTVRTAERYRETAALLDDELGPERRSEWLAAAEDAPESGE
jgi:predicted ArsR family transcriptional regulator